MWTPKRILLLVGGFMLFSVAYGIYAYFLGGVNGLPPLPPDCERVDVGDELLELPAPPIPLVEMKLKLAFGEDCPERKRTIRLEMRSRGIVLAADNFEIDRDGRVKLAPFSLAVFGNERDGQFPEITTVQSDVAYLRFDQPISSVADMASRKIVGGELRRDPHSRRGPNAGGVTIVNNRRTPQRDDDLTLTTPGPVFYEESRQQIWTAEAVHIVDEQSRDKANPTTIDAIGMDVYLESENDAKPATARKETPGRKNVAITGVKALALRSDVDMRLYVDARSGFLVAPARTPRTVPAADADAASPVKDLVHIKTQGPFHYDVATDRARFDISQHPGVRPNSVEVVRRTGLGGACDQLDCEHLELQFIRKNTTGPGGTSGPLRFDDNRGLDLEIDNAHAWGHQVTLASDSECLTAFGNDLVYDARSRQSILKGHPEMVALKDGHEIRARQLVLIGVGDRETQQARIQGPGIISLLDSASRERTQQARFQEQLITSKDGAFDLLTLTGEAAFEELEPGQQLQPGQPPRWRQRLQADRIKVWLEPVAAGPQRGDARRHRPHHLEAIGQVTAQSSEMTVHDTERLLIWFKDASATPAAEPSPAASLSEAENHVARKPNASTQPVSPGPGLAASSSKPKRPIDLCARSVDAYVVRSGPHTELEKLWCEGNVRVIQAPENAGERGVDIRGQTLQLTRYPEGHVLVVTGDLAEVQMDKLTILGPEVNIDQKENKAWVNGLGAMRLPSNANFRGGKLERPTDLTIHWNRDMFFNGKYALFHGGVQAEQDHARLTCQTMQVFLDQFVSLKEGNRSGAPAKVENLVCDKSVRVEDSERHEGRLVRYQRLESIELSFNNEDGIMVAPGPGILRILQRGPKDNGPTPPARRPAVAEEEMKLTRITYLERMFANNSTRTAVFYGNVEVVHVPTEDVNLLIDLDHLPAGALHLRCDQLKVYSRREVNAKGEQLMEARGHAQVQSREFYGRADVIKFDESKELVVFEANEGNLATLYRQKTKGSPHEELKGKKIYYWRKTNDFKIEGGSGASVLQ